MSTTTLYPVADGDLLELTPSTGTAHYALVDEATADDSDYLSVVASNTKNDRFTLGTLSLPDKAVIVSVTVNFRAKSPYGTVSIYLRSGTVNGTFCSALSINSGSFKDFAVTLRANPLTCAAFTATDLSGATIQATVQSSSGTSYLSQLYFTVTYIIGGSACLVLRPNADKAASSMSIQPTSPTTRYDKIDEAAEDTNDYIYMPSGGGSLGTFELGTGTGVGTITHATIHAKVQATKSMGNVCVNINTTAWADQYLLDTNEHDVSIVLETNPATSVAWQWSDLDSLYATIRIVAPYQGEIRCYQLWVEVWYAPPVYFDNIVCNSAGGGYVAVSGVLRGDCSTPAYKRAQVASDSGFGTILADSTELAATETPGNPMVITFSWTPSAVGTYYARLGVRASGEGNLTWITLTFTVTFPTVTGVTVDQAGEHATVTVTVADNYMDPPEVTIFIDGQAVKGKLI